MRNKGIRRLCSSPQQQVFKRDQRDWLIRFRFPSNLPLLRSIPFQTSQGPILGRGRLRQGLSARLRGEPHDGEHDGDGHHQVGDDGDGRGLCRDVLHSQPHEAGHAGHDQASSCTDWLAIQNEMIHQHQNSGEMEMDQSLTLSQADNSGQRTHDASADAHPPPRQQLEHQLHGKFGNNR